jgi:hypothetical protein
MAVTTSQVKTWWAFYDTNHEQIPTLQAGAYEMSFANYDTMTQALNQAGGKFVLHVPRGRKRNPSLESHPKVNPSYHPNP